MFIQHLTITFPTSLLPPTAYTFFPLSFSYKRDDMYSTKYFLDFLYLYSCACNCVNIMQHFFYTYSITHTTFNDCFVHSYCAVALLFSYSREIYWRSNPIVRRLLFDNQRQPAAPGEWHIRILHPRAHGARTLGYWSEGDGGEYGTGKSEKELRYTLFVWSLLNSCNGFNYVWVCF